MPQEFRWPVARDYEWREVRTMGAYRAHGQSVAVLCPVGSVRREYAPLKEDRLFREFAAIQHTAQGFREFAREYGLLGLTRFSASDDDAEGGELANDLPGYLSWESTHSGLYQAVWLWDVFKGRRPRSDIQDFLSPRVKEKAKRQKPEPRRRIETNELLSQLELRVTDKLAQHALAPRITVERAGRSGRFIFEYEPQTLAAALWLQCAWAITGRQDFVECGYCGTWLELTRRPPGKGKQRGRRTDARFCSNLCRASWHQQQKRKG